MARRQEERRNACISEAEYFLSLSLFFCSSWCSKEHKRLAVVRVVGFSKGMMTRITARVKRNLLPDCGSWFRVLALTDAWSASFLIRLLERRVDAIRILFDEAKEGLNWIAYPWEAVFPILDSFDGQLKCKGELELREAKVLPDSLRVRQRTHTRKFFLSQGRIVRIGEGVGLDLLFGHVCEPVPVGLAFSHRPHEPSEACSTQVPSENILTLTICSSLMFFRVFSSLVVLNEGSQGYRFMAFIHE